MELRITVRKELTIESLGGRGHDRTFELANHVTILEKVPVGEDAYIVSLHKDVNSSQDASSVEQDLLEILESLAIVWPIIPGCSFGLSESRHSTVTRYESNRAVVEKALREKEGLRWGCRPLKLGWTVRCIYPSPPLGDAIKLMEAVKREPELKILIEYYSKALDNRGYWFVELYKMQDQFKRLHGLKNVCEVLSIPASEWGDFETILNNYNHRHRGRRSKTGQLPVRKVNEVHIIARRWINKELANRGLPFSPV